MSDLILRTTTRAEIARYNITQTLRAAVERVAGEEHGQDLVEYAGILVIVAGIVAAVVALNIPQDINNKVKPLVTKILGG